MTLLRLQQNPNRQFPPSPSHKTLPVDDSHWLPSSEIPPNFPEPSLFEAYHATSAIIEESYDTDEDHSLTTSWLRIKKDNPNNNNFENASFPHPFIPLAETATRSTLQWCDSIVASLGLCPYARSSLDSSDTSLRIKIIPYEYDDNISGRMLIKESVRRTAEELLRVTGLSPWPSKEKDDGVVDYVDHAIDENMKYVDRHKAISFVVVVPMTTTMNTTTAKLSSGDCSVLPSALSFESFYSLACELEDELWDEAGEDDPLVTIAPFHPRWRFASSDDGNGEHGESDPTDFEKRAPYPTISIVLTEAIKFVGGKDATERIGATNEGILRGLGGEALERLFRERIDGHFYDE